MKTVFLMMSLAAAFAADDLAPQKTLVKKPNQIGVGNPTEDKNNPRPIPQGLTSAPQENAPGSAKANAAAGAGNLPTSRPLEGEKGFLSSIGPTSRDDAGHYGAHTLGGGSTGESATPEGEEGL